MIPPMLRVWLPPDYSDTAPCTVSKGKTLRKTNKTLD